jgi:hypothetical protein
LDADGFPDLQEYDFEASTDVTLVDVEDTVERERTSSSAIQASGVS